MTNQYQSVLTLIPDREPIQLIAYYDSFLNYYPMCELQTKYWFVEHVQPDWILIDAGANVGYYSILFAQLASTGTIYAFEPTSTFDMLQANLIQNDVQNVQPLRKAVGKKSGQINDRIFRIWGEAAEKAVYDFTTIDDFVNEKNITKLDCIKIDVDSYDFEVLQGARTTLTTLNPIVVVELNYALQERGQTVKEAVEWMISLGYKHYIILDEVNYIFFPGTPSAEAMTFTQAVPPPLHTLNPEDYSSPVNVSSYVATRFAGLLHPPQQKIADIVRTKVTPEPIQWQSLRTHNQCTVTRNQDSTLAFTTPPAAWGYCFDLPFALDSNERHVIEIVAQIRHGEVGVGLIHSDLSSIQNERIIVASDNLKVLYLDIPDNPAFHRLVVRTGDTSTTATVTSFSATILRLKKDAHHVPSAKPEEVIRFPEVQHIAAAQVHAALGFDTPLPTSAFTPSPDYFKWKMEVDDAPILRYLYQQFKPRRHLEFGTWEGFGTALCLEACDATVWTINLLEGEKRDDGSWAYGRKFAPDETVPGWSNRQEFSVETVRKRLFKSKVEQRTDVYYQTDALGFVGRIYRDKGLSHRVCQIYCDSRQWDDHNYPADFFDSVLIDGGHTQEIVSSDTHKALKVLRPGGLIMWHDYNPSAAIYQAYASTRGVVDALHHEMKWLQSQVETLFWIEPSFLLIGIRK